MNALSWPATGKAQSQGCTCPDGGLTLAEYGEPPTFECDALCPVHGLEQLRKAHA